MASADWTSWSSSWYANSWTQIRAASFATSKVVCLHSRVLGSLPTCRPLKASIVGSLQSQHTIAVRSEGSVTFILGPNHSAYSYFREIAGRLEIRNGAIVVAWARRSGVGLLRSALGEENLVNVDVVVGMANRGTSAEALALLRSMTRRVFVYHKHHLQTFHPKVYLFDDGQSPPTDAVLLVGSSNLTGGGLYQNIEGNLTLGLQPSFHEKDRAIYDSVVQEIAGLQSSTFCEQLVGDEQIKQLLEDRYISTESTLVSKRRRDNSEVARRGERRFRPEAPPPPLPRFALPPLQVRFGGVEREGAIYEQSHIGYQAIVVNDPTEEFYVRTLTANDVNKLHGITPGTAEWDIGVTARNARPAFWGWPARYTNVVRRLPRLEWQMTGSLQSSVTGVDGVEVEISLWFREERPGHAAEHRLRIGPRSTLVDATPRDFDTTSLVVLERLPRRKIAHLRGSIVD